MIHSLPCYAKINLFLEVLSKKPDGFHDIFTLFQLVDIHDTLEAERADKLSLTGAETVTEDFRDNLVYRAAELMHSKYSPGAGIHFNLKKILPAGAGLGGGSSNCAAAIKLCNKVWELNLPDEELLELSIGLGSDVPFFMEHTTAFGRGRGTLLEPAPSPHPYHLVIATPHVAVNTGEAYALLASKKSTPGHSVQEYLDSRNDAVFYRLLTNDFESVILKAFPQIKTLKNEIEAFAPVKVMLSGSGSSLFGLFENRAEADKCAEKIRRHTRFQALTQFLQK